MKQRIAIGLSGGVDSSAAAALLIEQGHEVTGVHLTCWSGLGCRSEEDRQEALDLALQLKLPFVHLDFQAAYKERVFEYMMTEYEAGRTPNPDVVCNREVKFGLFYDWAIEQGFDFVATGHYAQTDGITLLRSKDEQKDQTYFLHQLRQEQLKHILFPIGHLTKEQVRAEAEKRQLVSAKRPDSQGICFIGEVSVSKFLEERIEKKQGDILLNGKVVGTHRGVWFYTVGQRIALDQKKLSGFDQTNLPHFYVVKKDIANNVLYGGTREQLYVDEIEVTKVHWIKENKPELVRVRHGGALVLINELQAENERLRIRLEQPVWGVAPGQSAVFYAGNACLGGGIVELSG
jgi:tRNA-uridine 2-sulfurtransferase